jgi:hypothetical protein
MLRPVATFRPLRPTEVCTSHFYRWLERNPGVYMRSKKAAATSTATDPAAAATTAITTAAPTIPTTKTTTKKRARAPRAEKDPDDVVCSTSDPTAKVAPEPPFQYTHYCLNGGLLCVPDDKYDAFLRAVGTDAFMEQQEPGSCSPWLLYLVEVRRKRLTRVYADIDMHLTREPTADDVRVLVRLIQRAVVSLYPSWTADERRHYGTMIACVAQVVVEGGTVDKATGTVTPRRYKLPLHLVMPNLFIAPVTKRLLVIRDVVIQALETRTDRIRRRLDTLRMLIDHVTPRSTDFDDAPEQFDDDSVELDYQDDLRREYRAHVAWLRNRKRQAPSDGGDATTEPPAKRQKLDDDGMAQATSAQAASASPDQADPAAPAPDEPVVVPNEVVAFPLRLRQRVLGKHVLLDTADPWTKGYDHLPYTACDSLRMPFSHKTQRCPCGGECEICLQHPGLIRHDGGRPYRPVFILDGQGRTDHDAYVRYRDDPVAALTDCSLRVRPPGFDAALKEEDQATPGWDATLQLPTLSPETEAYMKNVEAWRGENLKSDVVTIGHDDRLHEAVAIDGVVSSTSLYRSPLLPRRLTHRGVLVATLESLRRAERQGDDGDGISLHTAREVAFYTGIQKQIQGLATMPGQHAWKTCVVDQAYFFNLPGKGPHFKVLLWDPKGAFFCLNKQGYHKSYRVWFRVSRYGIQQLCLCPCDVARDLTAVRCRDYESGTVDLQDRAADLFDAVADLLLKRHRTALEATPRGRRQ